MKNKINATVIAMLVIMVSVASSFAQSKRPVLGGYKEINVNGADVKSIAEFAVSAESKRSEKEIELISVIKAEQQTVQGSNYRLCLKINDAGAEGQDAAEVFVKALVNVDLKGKKKLVSWEASDCDDEDEPAAVGSAPEPRFKPIANSDAGAGLAADFATQKHSEKTNSTWILVKIVKAEDQEIGLMSRNFRLCMSGTANGKPSRAQAVVSMDQYSNFKLLSWADARC